MHAYLAQEILDTVVAAEQAYVKYCDRNMYQDTVLRVMEGFALVKAGLIASRELRPEEEN